jgi:hypothetical protein
VVKRNILKSFLVILFLFKLSVLSAQIISPFNNKSINIESAKKELTFIVSGHFHGSSANQSTFPASTLLSGIDTINKLEPQFLMSLGDLFLDVNDTYIKNYSRSLFNKLQMPLFNAVGNHDLSNGNVYSKLFGETFYSFSINQNLFIVLNTEENDGSIKNTQLGFFKTTLTTAQEQFENIFIFSHRPVWAENNKRYEGLFAGNTRTEIGSNNFENEIKPLLLPVAKTKSVYWMSGSVAGGPASFFYDKDPVTGIVFMQTAIRDLPRDAVLYVTINDSGVKFKCISLTGQELKEIESYDIAFWSSTVAPEERFNYRLIPYLTFQMVRHCYFWFGMLSASLIFLLIFLSRKWKRRK